MEDIPNYIKPWHKLKGRSLKKRFKFALKRIYELEENEQLLRSIIVNLYYKLEKYNKK